MFYQRNHSSWIGRIVHTPLLLGAFSLSLLYGLYHVYVSQMIIVHDAIVFEGLGVLLKENNWVAYLKEGPNREPLYPFLISLAMRVGECLASSYQDVQKFFQLLSLVAAQVLTLKILERLRLPVIIQALTVLYIGFSPSFINTVLSLWSEVISYPFVLGIILVSHSAWQEISSSDSKSYKRTIRIGIGLGFLFLGVSFVKCVFEVIIQFFYLFFLILAFKNHRSRKVLERNKIFLFLLSLFLAFSIPVHFYKLLNKHYNGHYALTYRGNSTLYGNLVQRQQPLSPSKLWSAIVCISGNSWTQSWTQNDLCAFWSQQHSDQIGFDKVHQLTQEGLSNRAIEDRLSKEIVTQFFKRPAPYIVLTIVHGLKMFLWESAEVGFVAYPAWLRGVYKHNAVFGGLNLMIGMLSLMSYAFIFLIFVRKKFDDFIPDSSQRQMVILIMGMISVYVFLHALVTPITRYILPMAPLYLIVMAYSLNRLIVKK